MTPAPVAESDVSTGELGRRLDRFEKTVTDALGGISSKLDDRPDWVDVRKIEAGLKESIKRLEDWQAWAVRLVLGAVILAVLGGVVITRGL